LTGLNSASTGIRPIGAVLVLGLVGGDVALPGLNRQLHVQRGAVVEVADHVVGVQDLDPRAFADLAGRDLARAFAAQRQALGAVGFHLDRDGLDVEHDVGDVLAHAGDRAELMQHAVDLDRGDRRALQAS
jgi:hypothetical protein